MANAVSNLINGYSFNLVARLGIANDVPRLFTGEFGWDTDVKTLRIGDDSVAPPRIPTTKSTGSFDFSLTTSWTMPEIIMKPGAKVDGVTVSKLNASNGLLVRKASDEYTNISIVCGDSTLQITNGDGTKGNIDIRLHPDILNAINAGYLSSVVSSAAFTGNGTAAAPLDIKAASTTQVGATKLATADAINAGESNAVALTPLSLRSLTKDSATTAHLRGIIKDGLVLSVGDGITGDGFGSQLTLQQAEEQEIGGAKIATQALADAGTDDSSFITAKKLKNLAKGSATVKALKDALDISQGSNEATSLSMTGPGVLGRKDSNSKQPVQVIPYSSAAKVTAGVAENDKDIVDQATLKYFFPKGAVRPLASPTSARPAANSLPQGSIIYDSTLQKLYYSNGADWNVYGSQMEIIAAHLANTKMTYARLEFGGTVGYASRDLYGQGTPGLTAYYPTYTMTSASAAAWWAQYGYGGNGEYFQAAMTGPQDSAPSFGISANVKLQNAVDSGFKASLQYRVLVHNGNDTFEREYTNKVAITPALVQKYRITFSNAPANANYFVMFLDYRDSPEGGEGNLRGWNRVTAKTNTYFEFLTGWNACPQFIVYKITT